MAELESERREQEVSEKEVAGYTPREKKGEDANPVVVKLPPRFIPKGIASAGLLSYIIVSKYADPTATTLLAGSNFLKETRSQRGTTDLLRMEYTFDNHGNLTLRKDAIRRHEEEFTYDNLNRLDQQRQKISGGSWGTWTNLADYDNLGNITSKAGVNGSYTYGSTRPHAVTSVGGVNYAYNKNGNVKLRGDHPIWWTAFNKPLSIFSADASYSFYYDNDFNRIIETIYGEGFSRVKINVSALYQVEIEDGVKTRRRHISTPVGVVGTSSYAESNQTTARRYFLKDHLGSSSVIADDSGMALSHYSYDAWGNPRNASDWSGLSSWPDYEADEGFTGHEMMSGLELVHMNGRVYDPLIGRFLSPDIFIQAAGNLQNYNRYSYVLNNPLKYVDPSGNAFFSIVATLVAAAGKNWAAHQLFLLFFLGGFLDAYVESGDVGVSLKAGLISGASAYLAHEIGSWFQDGWAAKAFEGQPSLANVVKATFHGVRGGIAAEMSGGSFGSGAAAAFFGDYGGRLGGEYVGEGPIMAAIVGGTASELGGGKFSNGALSGAMTFVLGTAIHREQVPITDSTGNVLTDAKLSEGFQNDHNFPGVDGYSQVFARKHKPTGLRAALYSNGAEHVLVYAGTDLTSCADWWANLKQAFGFKPAHYEMGIKWAEGLVAETSKFRSNLRFTGYSLGGGLASAAAIVTGRSANTFNAAAINKLTINNTPRSQGRVNSYYSSFDIVQLANMFTPASVPGQRISLGFAGFHGMGSIVEALQP